MGAHGLKCKIILPTFMMLFFLVVTLTVLSSLKFSNFVNIHSNDRITVIANGLKNYLNDCRHNSKVAAVSAAERPEIAEAAKGRGAQELAGILSSLCDLYKVDFLTVTDSFGTALAGTHAMGGSGEIEMSQQNLMDALNGEISTYFESGAHARIAAHTSAPIYGENGELIGVVTAGVLLDTNEAVDRLKEYFKADFSVYHDGARIATTLMKNGERYVDSQLDYELSKTVLEDKQEHFGQMNILGINYNMYYIPLLDPRNEVFAVLIAGVPNTQLISDMNALIFGDFLIGLAGLAVSVAMLLFIVSRITKPIKGLVRLVSEVRYGNLDIDMDKSGVTRDEIGALTLDIYSLVDVIQSMVTDLSQLTSGLNIYSDIDFQVDTGKYSGPYKKIFDEIKTLVTSISMMNKTMAVMDYVDNMISVIDFDYNLLYVNRNLADISGVDRQSCQNQKCYKALKNRDEPCAMCQLQHLLPDDEDSFPSVTYTDLYDESLGCWIGGRAAIMKWVDGSKVLFHSFYDETQKKNSERQLREALEEAEAATAAKSAFLAKMSHEIRTPMNAVIGMAELLSREPLDGRQTNYVNDITASAHSLLYIIDEILDMSKIESGKMVIAPVHYDFQKLIDSIVSMFGYMAENKKLEFRFEKEGELPGYLFGDETRLRQILTNICGNAVKFTEQGYVRLKITAAADTLIFEIKDTGIGIKKESIPKMFDAFEQAKTAKPRGSAGTGLGLAISSSFVEMMGGTIALDSEYGKGTTVTIRVPLVEGDKEIIIVDEQAANKQQSVYAPNADILVVDDNEYNLKVAHGLLELFKIDAKTAFSGKEAIAMVQKSEFDIIFMDHMMPDMDGVETAEKIRKLGGRHEHAPIIALTANAVHGTKETLLEKGFDDFLSKPMDLQALAEALVKWLPPEKISRAPELPEPKQTEGRTDCGFWDELCKAGEIDPEIGLRFVNGMRDVYRENLRLFYDRLDAECDNMSACMGGGELARFSLLAHSMKSALSGIGAAGLSKAAAALETAARENDADFCAAGFPEFLQSLLSLRARLSRVFPPEGKLAENVGKKRGETGYLQKTAQKALEAVSDFDTDSGLEAVNSLLAYDFGGRIGALLESAATAMKKYDYDGSKDILSELLAGS